MEIEVGDYIKTSIGNIAKIKRIEVDEVDTSLKWYVFDKKRPNMNIIDEIYLNKPYIVKHSKQLIDLIEVGDILQVEISEEWTVKEDTIRFIIVGQTYEIQKIKEALEDGIYKIRKILTHEQFEQNCYRLEE